jgi:hypothetical protein
VKKNREDAAAAPEAASEESVASAELRAQVARQQLRLAKERLKRARKQFKEAKREAKSLRKLAAAEQRALRRAMRKNKKKPAETEVAAIDAGVSAHTKAAKPGRVAGNGRNDKTKRRRAAKTVGRARGRRAR